jgi:sugar lactone lactonase YvrE
MFMFKFHLAESPMWHANNNHWMWTDILTNKVCVMAFGNLTFDEKKNIIHVPQMVSNLIELEDGSVLASAENGLFLLSIGGESFKTIVTLPHSENFRCNDGSVGPDGKYWFGTMQKSPTGLNGEIYSLDRKGNLRAQNIPIGIPNSFIWLNDHSLLISDSFLQKTYKVDLAESGNLDWSNSEVWLDLSATEMTPDGGALDAEGNVWLAMWGGAVVNKYSSKGVLLDTLKLQALQPTSCAFGGVNRDELLITTATEGLTEQQIKEYPDSGKVLFRKMPVQGKVLPKFRLDI